MSFATFMVPPSCFISTLINYKIIVTLGQHILSSPSYSTVPVSSVNVPKLVTVPANSNLPASVKVTEPPVASKAPLASNVPVPTFR